MSDKMRWRYGETNPVVAAVDSGTVVEIGDLVYQYVDQAWPASHLLPDSVTRFGCTTCNRVVPAAQHDSGMLCPACQGRNWENLQQRDIQEAFANSFLGVAMQRSRSGDTDTIRVATTGVFEFDCPSGTWGLGDLVGATINPRAPGVLSQSLDSVD
jgi:hypothetical protein